MKDLKISFTGDIMFERQYVKACLTAGKSFDAMFEHVKKLIGESDYVVGNLETVCAGKEQKYSHEIYSFNSPDSVIDALKQSGISMVTTANNHCLDRGVPGLLRTLEELDKRGLDHTGTFNRNNEKEKFLIRDFFGFKIAFVSYTYGTNYVENRIELKDSETGCINLLKPQKSGKITAEEEKANQLRKTLVKISQSLFSSDIRMKIKKILRLRLNVPVTDKISDGYSDKTYLAEFASQIQKAKQVSDFVFLCVHTGGQFNDKPGEFSEFIMNYSVRNGVDAIIGHHPHVVQKFNQINSVPVFYSLGNFSFSPGSLYVLHDLLPEYSVMPHFYFSKAEGKYQLKKITYSILKTIEDNKNMVQVVPVTDLLKKTKEGLEKQKLISDANFIAERLCPVVKQLDFSVSEIELYCK
ncbi:MAG: hypothetical protein BGO33_07945 [Bacteroidia bacterium 43-41]|nr:MAG: hypothetical protein BGO33_07945 [Bacteroidia bacterium 43-41]